MYLQRVPGYDDAKSVHTVDAAELTESRFQRDYVDRMRPCVARGAVKHWPAFSRWRDIDYLRRTIGNPTVIVAVAPLIEPRLSPANAGAMAEASFESVLERLREDTPRHLVLHAYSLGRGDSSLAALGEDVHGFPFVGAVAGPRIYPPKRAFLFRGSYTDWHFHRTDETLMCQVKGDKEVLLLPPDAWHFELTRYVRNRNSGRLWDVDVDLFPDWEHLEPYRALVAEGDALYIPTFWHHAVESVGSDFGWTVAWCWRTPAHLFDPRLAGVRETLGRLLRSRRAPFALAAALWSSVRRLGRPPFTI